MEGKKCRNGNIHGQTKDLNARSGNKMLIKIKKFKDILKTSSK